jgi:hypothetical protein
MYTKPRNGKENYGMGHLEVAEEQVESVLSEDAVTSSAVEQLEIALAPLAWLA